MGTNCCVYFRARQGGPLPPIDHKIIPLGEGRDAASRYASLVGYTHTVDYPGRWPSSDRSYRWWDGLRPLLMTLREHAECVWCHSDAWWPGDAWDWGHDRHLTLDEAVVHDYATCIVTDEQIAQWDSEWAPHPDVLTDAATPPAPPRPPTAS